MPCEAAFRNVPNASRTNPVALIVGIEKIIAYKSDTARRAHTCCPWLHFAIGCNPHCPATHGYTAFATPPFFVAKSNIGGDEETAIGCNSRTKRILVIMSTQLPSVNGFIDIGSAIAIFINEFGQFATLRDI